MRLTYDPFVVGLVVVSLAVLLWGRRRKRRRARRVVAPSSARADYNSYHWRKVIRPAALRRAGYQCEAAGCRERRGLEVHHWRYPGPGLERLSDVSVYCKLHHDIADAQRRAWERMSG